MRHLSSSVQPVFPPRSDEVFGYGDEATQRRARENEDRRSRITNPCVKAYGKLL